MKKYITLFTLALCLCIGKVWGAIDWKVTGQTVVSGETYYIYNVGIGKFLNQNSGTDNASEATTWEVSYNNKGAMTWKCTFNNVNQYLYVRKNSGSFNIQYDGNANTGAFTSTTRSTQGTDYLGTGYKYYHPDSRYLNMESNKSLTAARTNGINNDWLLVSEDDWEIYVEMQNLQSAINSAPAVSSFTYTKSELVTAYENALNPTLAVSTSTSSEISAALSALNVARANMESYDALMHCTVADCATEGARLISQAEAISTSAFADEISDIENADELEEYSQAFVALRAAVSTYINSHPIAANTDMTLFINNASFELGTTYGWTLQRIASQDKNYPSDYGVKSNSTDPYTVAEANRDGVYLYNTWANDNFGGDGLYQTITGLPNGTYRVSAWLTSDASYSPCLRVNDTYTAMGSHTDKADMKQVTYDVTVSDGSLTIGARGQEYSYKYALFWDYYAYYWFKVDKFQLTLLSNHEIEQDKAMRRGFCMLYNASNNIRMEDDDANAYYATWLEGGTTLNLTNAFSAEGTDRILEAGTPVLIYNSSKPSKVNYSLTTVAANSSTDGNQFSAAGNSAGNAVYVLVDQNEEVAFYKYTAAIDEGNCFLVAPQASNSPARFDIRISEEDNTATALVPVYDDQPNNTEFGNGQIYTILGIPVRDMSRPGIYIQNGKKYVVR